MQVKQVMIGLEQRTRSKRLAMELDNFSSGSRKRLDHYRSSRSFNAVLPGRAADSESLLRSDVPRLLFQAKKEVIDEPFNPGSWKRIRSSRVCCKRQARCQ